MHSAKVNGPHGPSRLNKSRVRILRGDVVLGTFAGITRALNAPLSTFLAGARVEDDDGNVLARLESSGWKVCVEALGEVKGAGR